ncbi:MAG TPA: hypothetical protein VF608_05740, partial [Thermoanaerobaculia bacterium]
MSIGGFSAPGGAKARNSTMSVRYLPTTRERGLFPAESALETQRRIIVASIVAMIVSSANTSAV